MAYTDEFLDIRVGGMRPQHAHERRRGVREAAAQRARRARAHHAQPPPARAPLQLVHHLAHCYRTRVSVTSTK